VKLADPVTVKQLLGWAAGAVVGLFIAAMSCGNTTVSAAREAARSEVRVAESEARDAKQHVDVVELRIENRLDTIERDIKELLKRGAQ
jgi:hypothetical protein